MVTCPPKGNVVAGSGNEKCVILMDGVDLMNQFRPKFTDKTLTRSNVNFVHFLFLVHIFKAIEATNPQNMSITFK
jgi:hypothetical protein